MFCKRRTIGLYGGPLLAIITYLTPFAGLTVEAHKLLAIMVLVAIWWITEPVPIPVTSLIGSTLAVVTATGGEPSRSSWSRYSPSWPCCSPSSQAHTATTNMIGPIAITVAISAGLSPIPVAVGIALSASLGFMLPVSTPPNAIVYASGYIPITKMIHTGNCIDFIGIACVTIPLVI